MVLDPSGYKDVTQDPEVMVGVIFKILTMFCQAVFLSPLQIRYLRFCGIIQMKYLGPRGIT